MSGALPSQAFLRTLGDTPFRLLVEAVEDYAIFMLDPGGLVVSWNSGAQHIKGYEAAEIIGRHFSTFYCPEDIDAGKPEAELAEAAARGRAEDEGWRLRRDGTRFWASVTITAIRTPDGVLHGFAKVTRDMTERRRLVELQHAAALSSHVQAAREEERSRIARELHDDLGQQLVALKMDVARRHDAQSVGKQPALLAHIDTMLASVRRIAGGLRPPMLDDLGLAAALDWLATECRVRQGIHVTLQNRAQETRFSAATTTAIYRIVQEALTNVSRHAPGAQVDIALDCTGDECTLHIADDGPGANLDEARGPSRFGLIGMAERVRQCGGTFSVQSALGHGFALTIRLPIGVSID